MRARLFRNFQDAEETNSRCALYECQNAKVIVPYVHKLKKRFVPFACGLSFWQMKSSVDPTHVAETWKYVVPSLSAVGVTDKTPQSNTLSEMLSSSRVVLPKRIQHVSLLR